MKYGLIGEKLGHSYSKVIHSKIGDYKYELKEINRDDFDDYIMAKEFCGINITIPYKQCVIPLLDYVDPLAKDIGAVNTVVNKDGKLYGYNTDYIGFNQLISRLNVDIKGKKVLIAGSGGTSFTAQSVLKNLGASEIYRLSRNGKEGCITYQEAYERHNDAGFIVNTTPSGMFPDVNSCAIDLNRFNFIEGVVDVVYNPLETILVKKAKELGIKAEGGLYMLVAQAVYASSLFFEIQPNDRLTEKIFNDIKLELARQYNK